MAYVYTGIFHQNGRPEKLYFWGQVIGVTHPQKRPWLDPYGLQYHGQSLLQVMSTKKKTFAGDLVGGIAYLPLWKMMEFVSWDEMTFPIYIYILYMEK